MGNDGEMSLESVRESLIRQEDTIVFSLIERAKFPFNSPAYTCITRNQQQQEDSSSASAAASAGSLVEYFVKETEIVNAKVGRYINPEEHPFFPDDLPLPLCPPAPAPYPQPQPQVLYPAGASININNTIWNMYFDQLLPLFVAEGDAAANYASTADSDLKCLQALSRRIHYGKFVAEVKFRDAPQDYQPAIRAQDRDALMKLLTFESVEEMVKRRVEKKAMLFGQQVSIGDDNNDNGNYKVDPSIVSRLYAEWVMPLTKLVQVEYLLRRLD